MYRGIKVYDNFYMIKENQHICTEQNNFMELAHSCGKDKANTNMKEVHKDKEKEGPFIKQTDILEEQYNDQKYISTCENKETEESSMEKKEFSATQNFHNIRDECLRDKVLFEDPDFLPCNASLFVQKDHWDVNLNIQWKRASQICANPRLLIDGATRFDIKQGELGDCWLLAAMTDLTLHKKLLHKVVPLDQSFIEGYAGVFHFR
jgi:hypothetical protein